MRQTASAGSCPTASIPTPRHKTGFWKTSDHLCDDCWTEQTQALTPKHRFRPVETPSMPESAQGKSMIEGASASPRHTGPHRAVRALAARTALAPRPISKSVMARTVLNSRSLLPRSATAVDHHLPGHIFRCSQRPDFPADRVWRFPVPVLNGP